MKHLSFRLFTSLDCDTFLYLRGFKLQRFTTYILDFATRNEWICSAQVWFTVDSNEVWPLLLSKRDNLSRPKGQWSIRGLWSLTCYTLKTWFLQRRLLHFTDYTISTRRLIPTYVFLVGATVYRLNPCVPGVSLESFLLHLTEIKLRRILSRNTIIIFSLIYEWKITTKFWINRYWSPITNILWLKL